MKKTVDFESIPLILEQCLGIPKANISVENDPVRQWSGVKITSLSGSTVTFWYDWKDRKIQVMKVKTSGGKIE